MSKEKKKWETPKLICLYRARPEEAVLLTCKGTPGSGMSGPNANNKCNGPPSCVDQVVT